MTARSTIAIPYRVGERNWINLWKPTRNALDHLLSVTPPAAWHPRDGRITRLGLHLNVDSAVWYDVDVHVRAEPIPGGLDVPSST